MVYKNIPLTTFSPKNHEKQILSMIKELSNSFVKKSSKISVYYKTQMGSAAKALNPLTFAEIYNTIEKDKYYKRFRVLRAKIVG